MAPALSSREITRIPRDPQYAQSLLSSPLLPVTRHSHCSNIRRISLAHKRRFRYRQFSVNSTAIVSASVVDGTPLPYSPVVDHDSSPFPSADIPATTTIVSDTTLSESGLQQSQARNRVTGITAALVAVCVLVGLTACAMMGRLAYRRRSSLLRRFRRHRQAEDNLGFVFIEYDNSAWGPPAKQMRKDMPSSERSPEAGEVHIELVSPGALTPNATPNVHPLVIEALPVTSRLLTPPPPTRELDPIIDTDGRDCSNAIPAEDFDACFKICHSATHSKMDILNALGLAMDSDDNVKKSTLAPSQLAATLASHPGEVDGGAEGTESTPSDSLASDLVACSSSSEDSELQSVDIHSMDFKHDITMSLADADCVEDKKSPLDVYDLPRVVVSSSSLDASEVSSCSNRASGVSVGTIDFGDFPRPPFIGDKLVRTSTSLISEIEVSLGRVISGGLGMVGRRGSSASQVTV